MSAVEAAPGHQNTGALRRTYRAQTGQNLLYASDAVPGGKDD